MYLPSSALGLMSIPLVGQLLFAKYTSPAAAVLILWDHSLTFDEEVATMWRSHDGQILTRVVYIMNRYFTEAVMLYTAYVLGGATANKDCANVFWLLTMTAVVLSSILQFFIMMRAYRLWDHKPIVRRVLLVMFVTCTAGAFIFAVMTDLTFSRTRIELPPTIIGCAYSGVPKTVPSALGFLMAFNIFVIVVSIYNALESPRRYENEVFYSLQRDGARMYLFVSLLWVVLLITSLVAEFPLFFPIFSLASSLKANLTSRMHLYIESLSNPTRPVVIYTGQEG